MSILNSKNTLNFKIVQGKAKIIHMEHQILQVNRYSWSLILKWLRIQNQAKVRGGILKIIRYSNLHSFRLSNKKIFRFNKVCSVFKGSTNLNCKDILNWIQIIKKTNFASKSYKLKRQTLNFKSLMWAKSLSSVNKK